MTQDQFGKLDKCYFEYSLTDRCVEEIVDARILLGTHRFDFYGILFYVDQKVKGVTDLSFAQKVYKERTRAMTGFKLSEIGNDNKSSFADFLSVLDKLIQDFQNENYDYEKTLIPVDKKGEPIDGAHRVSCAAYFNKKIKILRFLDREVSPYNYEYVRHEFLPTDIGDIMALEALKWHDDIYALFLWPKAHKNSNILQKAIQLISNQTDILYQVEHKLTFEAIKTLMVQLYGHMDWVGSIDDGFVNIIGKADEVWDDNGKLRIILIRANSCNDVLALKTKIRGLYNMGLATVHSTDNIRETRMAMNALLNPNSRHHLLNADVTRYRDSYKLFSHFRDMLSAAGFNKNDFVLDSSMVLSIYGLRAARDLDYYCLHRTHNTPYPSDDLIEEHDETQKEFYSIPVQDLINNPQNYFVFNEIKFVTLQNLLQFKQSRFAKYGDPKDVEDIRLIKNVLNDQNRFIKCMRHACLMLKRKKRLYMQAMFADMVVASKKLHVYEALRVVKHFLR